MRKGIVIESGKEWTILLTPDGDFCRIPSDQNHREGKEVWFCASAVVQRQAKRRWVPKGIMYTAGLTACIMFMLFIFPFFGGTQAYASVNIDINPSIELEVDKQAIVIAAHAINEEGLDIIRELDWKNKQIVQVTVAVVRTAKLKGYMNSGNQVFISTTFYQDKSEEAAEAWDHLMEQIPHQTGDEYTVILVEGTKQWHDEAKEKGVAPGAYMLVKQAEKHGVILKDQDIQQGKIDLPEQVSGIKVLKAEKDEKGKQEQGPKAKEQQVKPADHSLPSPNKLKADQEKDRQHSKGQPKKEENERKNDKKEYSKSSPSAKGPVIEIKLPPQILREIFNKPGQSAPGHSLRQSDLPSKRIKKGSGEHDENDDDKDEDDDEDDDHKGKKRNHSKEKEEKKTINKKEDKREDKKKDKKEEKNEDKKKDKKEEKNEDKNEKKKENEDGRGNVRKDDDK